MFAQTGPLTLRASTCSACSAAPCGRRPAGLLRHSATHEGWRYITPSTSSACKCDSEGRCTDCLTNLAFAASQPPSILPAPRQALPLARIRSATRQHSQHPTTSRACRRFSRPIKARIRGLLVALHVMPRVGMSSLQQPAFASRCGTKTTSRPIGRRSAENADDLPRRLGTWPGRAAVGGPCHPCSTGRDSLRQTPVSIESSTSFG